MTRRGHRRPAPLAPRRRSTRSLRAGYDLVYVYAGHGLTTIQHFLSRRYNDRTDEYGGSIENRVAAAARDPRGHARGGRRPGRGRLPDLRRRADRRRRHRARRDRGVLGIVGELPDVWDFMVGDWDFDSITSRFAEEGAQEQYVRGPEALTTKPVVGVGRFTSADTMVRMVRDGVLDMIGSARPSIADPFLPKKIEEGRWEDIRECIGCNICVTGDFTATPLRCTQNPTMGEEWRRGWHPERIRPKTTDATVLVVGAGPAGLEAAHGARQARLRRGARRGHRRAGRAGRTRGAAARPVGVDPGARLPQAASSSGCPTSSWRSAAS